MTFTWLIYLLYRVPTDTKYRFKIHRPATSRLLCDKAASHATSLHVEDHLDGLAAGHQLEPLLEVRQRDLMGDDRVHVDLARQNQVLGLIPRLEHLAAVDAQDAGAFEDDV